MLCYAAPRNFFNRGKKGKKEVISMRPFEFPRNIENFPVGPRRSEQRHAEGEFLAGVALVERRRHRDAAQVEHVTEMREIA